MRHGRLAPLDVGTRSQVMSLRRHGMSVIDICERLGITKSSEINSVSDLCARDKRLRRYQFGIEVGAPVQRGRNAANARRE